MDFSLSDEQRAERDTFHRFAECEIRPQAESLYRHPRFPRELFTRADALGFFCLHYPEPEGSGFAFRSYILPVEDIPRRSRNSQGAAGPSPRPAACSLSWGPGSCTGSRT